MTATLTNTSNKATDEDGSPSKSRIGAIAALLAGAIAIGFAPVFAKIAIGEGQIFSWELGNLGASASGFWRMFLSMPILAMFMIMSLSSRLNPAERAPEERPKRTTRHWLILLLPGAIFGGDIAVWHYSFYFTTAAAATLLANTQVVLVGLVSWLILKERLKWQFPVGAMLALCGIIMLLVVGGEPISDGRNPLIGNLLGLLTACFYASYILTVQLARRYFDTLPTMIAVSATSTVVLLVVAVASGESTWHLNTAAWFAVIGMAVVPHCIGQGLVVYSLAKLPASFTSVTLLIQPVGAGVWAWLIIGEKLEPMHIAAGVIVLVGIYFARRGSI